MRKQFRTLALLLSVAALLAACTNPDDPHRRAKTGAAIGAVAGAVLGHQIDHNAGRYVGAVVGGLAGAGVGNYMDEQQQAFERDLAGEQAAHQVEIERLEDESLKLTLDSEVSFDFDRAEIKPAFMGSLDKLAGVIVRYDRTRVLIVGHTDSIGSESYNRILSERRAGSVASYLAERGVSWSRLQTEGRGEAEPRADNSTEAGRQLNRRVEIFLKPLEEGAAKPAQQPPDYYWVDDKK